MAPRAAGGHQPAPGFLMKLKANGVDLNPNSWIWRSMKRLAFTTLAAAVLAVSTAAAARHQFRSATSTLGVSPGGITAIAPAELGQHCSRTVDRRALATVRQLASARRWCSPWTTRHRSRCAVARGQARSTGIPRRRTGRAATVWLRLPWSWPHPPERIEGRVLRTLGQLAPSPETGTSLIRRRHLVRLTAGTHVHGHAQFSAAHRGHDVGSKATLDRAIAARNVQCRRLRDRCGGQGRLETLEENGRSNRRKALRCKPISRLGAIYAALGRELDRTWRISYLTRARPGDRSRSDCRRNGDAVSQLRVPGKRHRGDAAGRHENGSDGRRPGDPGCSTARRRGHGRHPAAARHRDHATAPASTSSSATRHRRGRSRGPWTRGADGMDGERACRSPG